MYTGKNYFFPVENSFLRKCFKNIKPEFNISIYLEIRWREQEEAAERREVGEACKANSIGIIRKGGMSPSYNVTKGSK